MKHYNITVRGKVQGVFFRASTKEKANELGLHGFVRNQSDGTVYLEAEGTEENLDKLVKWCNQGPPNAVVTNIKVEEAKWMNLKKFEIRYF